MSAVLHAAQTGPDIITDPAEVGIAGELLATGLQTVDVPDHLVLAPALEGITGNFHQVRFGAAGQTEASHGLAPFLRPLEALPDTRKRVACGGPAQKTRSSAVLEERGPHDRAHAEAGQGE
jgi:hypothetical protein